MFFLQVAEILYTNIKKKKNDFELIQYHERRKMGNLIFNEVT